MPEPPEISPFVIANIQSDTIPSKKFFDLSEGLNEGDVFGDTPFNKLEYLTPAASNKGIKAIWNRAKAKYIQEDWLRALASLNSPLHKNYTFALKCSENISQIGDTFTSKYCRNRFCMVCNRIRTGQLISGYEKTLDLLLDKQFVTLTRPNVPGENLKEEIRFFYAQWRLITRRIAKSKKIPLPSPDPFSYLEVNGIRKLEITYNPIRNDFHPHFHLIVDGKQQAQLILDTWLQLNPESSFLGQDLRPCTSYKDLFKYVTKMTSKVSKVADAQQSFYPVQMDVIFCAIKGERVFQSFGNVRKDVSEDIKEIQAMVIEEIDQDNTLWEWDGDDWYNVKKFTALAEFTPTEAQKDFRKRIIYRSKDNTPLKQPEKIPLKIPWGNHQHAP